MPDDSLEDHLIGAVPPMESDNGEMLPLDIDSREFATKMVRLYAQTQRAEVTVKAEADAEIAQIKAWRDDRLSGVRKRLEWVTTGLRQWMLSERARSGDKIKSISLPSGTVKTRAATVRVTVEGELTHEHAVKYPPVMETVSYSLDLVSARKVFGRGDPIGFDNGERLFQATYRGEVVPGIVFRVPLDPTFSVVPTSSEGRTDDE